MPYWLQAILAVGAGFAGGFLGGSFGGGGAVISTPLIRLIGVSALDAVGSTLPGALIGSFIGSVRYQRRGFVHWRAVAIIAPVGMIAVVGAARLTTYIPGQGHLLMIATAGAMAYAARALLKGADAAGHTDTTIQPAKLAVIGIGGGTLSGLLGLGGGIIIMPALHRWAKLALRYAIGTSIVCTFLLVIPGTLTFTVIDQINWGIAFPMSVGSPLGVILGTHFTIKSSDHRVRVVLAGIFVVVAVIYATAETYLLFR